MCDVFITALTKFYHKNFKFIVTIIGVMFTGCEPPQPQRTELEHNTIWNKSPEFNGKIHNSVLFISIAWCLIQQTKQKNHCGRIELLRLQLIWIYISICYMLHVKHCLLWQFLPAPAHTQQQKNWLKFFLFRFAFYNIVARYWCWLIFS